MSWLDDITPDAGDPSTGMILGLLGGLGKAATPMQGPNGMGIKKLNPLDALFGTLGDAAGGIQGGMQGAQAYKAANIANQSADINLQNQKMLNPLMVQARLNALRGISNNNPTGLPTQPGSMSGGMTPYQSNASHMIDAAQTQYGLTGDYKPLTEAWKSAFENDPSLAAEKGKQTTRNSMQDTPNGKIMGYQIPGVNDAPGGAGSPGLFGGGDVPFSLAPALASATIKTITNDREPAGQGPGNQTPPESGIPTPPTPQQLPPAFQSLPSNGQPMPQAPSMNASALAPQGGMNGGQPPQPPMPQQMGAQPPIQPVQQGALPPVAQRQASFVPPQQPSGDINSLIAAQKGVASNAPSQPSAMMAGDGKPILPSLANNPFYKPDPTGTPKFDTKLSENTNTAKETMIETNKKNIFDLSDGSKEFSELSGSLSNEKYSINQLASLLQSVNSGTAMAHLPELTAKAVAAGVISDPATVKSLSDLQAAIAIGAKQTLNNIKDNAGTMRIFGSEVAAQIKNGANVELQPQALYKILTMAGGGVDRGLDMVNSWQKAGGRGNRLADGNTMLPDDFRSQWLEAHPSDAYVKNFTAQTAPFMGMSSSKYPEGSVATNHKTGHTMTMRGGQWQ